MFTWVFFILCAYLVVEPGTSWKVSRQIASLCVEECTPPPSLSGREVGTEQLEAGTAQLEAGTAHCPEGYQCKYNGCGHICDKVVAPDGCTDCKDLGCFNDACDIDGAGCPICKGVGRRQERELLGLCAEECTPSSVSQARRSDPCPLGHQCRFNGCGHSCYKITGLRP